MPQATLAEVDRLFAFRMSQFLRMGFSAEQAEDLALQAERSQLDWHQVERWLESAKATGHPRAHSLIFKLAT